MPQYHCVENNTKLAWICLLLLISLPQPKTNMKRLLLLLILSAAGVVMSGSASAQCTFSGVQFPLTTFTPTSTTFQVASANIYAGEYSAYNVTAGAVYEWSLCTQDGGNATYDSQLSLFDASNTAFSIDYSDDFCGDDAKITWTATFTGQVYVQVNLYNCQVNEVSTTLVYRRASAPVAQGCPFSGTQFPSTIFTPTSTTFQVAATNIFAGEYSVYNVTAGSTYEWSTCVADGGNASYDSQLSLFNAANTTTAIAFADNTCGDDAKITWTAPFSGQVYLLVNQANCITNSTATTVVYRRSSAAGGGPANDNCVGATILPVGGNCAPVNATLQGATAGNPSTGCSGTNTDDVWFTFASISEETLYMDIVPTGAGIDPVVEVFIGSDCNSLQSVGCFNAGVDGEGEFITSAMTGVPFGTTIWLRVYDFQAAPASNPNFTVCVFQTNEFDVDGDDCETAIQVTTTDLCTQPLTLNLGDYNVSPATGNDCLQQYASDVWLQFSALSDSVFYDAVPQGANVDLIVEIYQGTDCGTMEFVGCADFTNPGEPESVVIGPLTSTDPFFVRIADINQNADPNLNFTFCAYDQLEEEPITNDECAGAILLNTSANCTPTAFSTLGATGSAPASSCSPGGSAAEDVWFRFVATSTSATIRVGAVNGSDPVIQYFSGTCTNLVSRGCSDFFIEGVDENLTATGLVVGQTYYVRVYDYRGVNATSNDFTICVIANASSPNDNCNTAIPLVTETPATYTYFNTALATQSSTGCTGNANDDVWFSFVAGENPAGTTISVGGDLDFSTVFQVYSGTCGNLTSVQCVNNVTTGTYDVETQAFTNLTPGQTYYIRVYDFDASVTNSTFYVYVLGTPAGCNLPAPVATAQGNTIICGNGAVNISVPQQAGITYQWRLDGVNIPGATSNIVSANQSGSYTVVITDAANCTATSNVIDVLIIPQPNPTITANGSATVCTGGSVTLSTTSQPGITYQWFRDSNPVAGATSASYNATIAGSYTLVATAAPGCLGTSNAILVSVVGAPTAVISAGGSTTICQGSNIVLSIATEPGVNVQWRLNGVNIGGATSNTFSANQAGTYTAVASVGANCSTTSNSITINVVPGPTASASAAGATEFCQGGSVTLNAAAVTGATYQWQNSGIAIPGATSQSYSATTSGNYSVVVSTSACSATSNSIDVVVNPSPVATASANGPTTVCQGGSVSLSAAQVNGASYQWNNGANPVAGATSSTFSATAAGNYTVTVTANGCSATSAAVSVTITPPPAATITASGSTTVCEGNTVTLNANTGANLSYQWLLNGAPINGATAQSYTAAVAGSYTVTVSQGANCSATSSAATVNILAAPQATVTASGPLAICQGGSVNLNAAQVAGNTYQWQVNGANIAGATNASYAANAAGSYAVVVTSTNGCASTSTASVVTVNPLPNATITPNGPTTFCVGGNVLLQGTSGNGLNYQWNNNGNAISGAVNSVLNVNQSGSYTVTVTDLNGCSATSSALAVNVAGTAAQISFTGNPAICDGNSVVLNANDVAGLSYQWSNNGAAISGATAQTFVASAGGNYTVTVTDQNNCASTSSVVTVTVGQTPGIPTVSAGGPTTFCEGDNVALSTSPSAGITYQWLVDGNPIAGANQNTFSAEDAGAYSLQVTNTAGCQNASEPISVNVNSLPAVSLTLGQTVVCLNTDLTLSGGLPAGGTYSGANISNGIFNAGSEGIFSVNYSFTDNNGCSASASADVQAEDCAGIETASTEGFVLYPNPAQESVVIESTTSAQVQGISVFDLSGRAISVEVQRTAQNRYMLNTAWLAAGTYQVVILTELRSTVKNFVKVQ